MATELVAAAPSEHSVKHDDRVAHHFESAQQQFDAGKQGMWLFLVTEVLFFSALFVAYAVYRSNHPEVFVNAHHYLNTTLGTLNTVVLLVSSLTMAWAVRSAQLNHRRALITLLTVTLACASLFLGVKAVEYSHKWDQGLLWAGAFAADEATGADHDSDEHASAASGPRALIWFSVPFAAWLLASVIGWLTAARFRRRRAAVFFRCLAAAAGAFFLGVVVGECVEALTGHAGPAHADPEHAAHATPTPGMLETSADPAENAELTGVFFSIYYAMTGVHALHILAGIAAISWLLWRSIGLEFDADYFGPVDYVGLYWHLVDLVWIYLFPLLYLIR